MPDRSFGRRACAAAAGALLALAAAAPASAGLLGIGEPEGGRVELPPPSLPALRTDKLVQVVAPAQSAVAIGVDPASISILSDGIVRYVSVARSLAGTAVNATYEGIRCSTAEVKLYARHYAEGEWQPQETPTWVSLYEPRARTSLAIAKAGVCKDASANLSPQQILLDMRGDPNRGTP
ncbi:CNP1-like family protein [Xylophilus ampelinus]|uniref:CNP1-like family protein n=1 Tax=Xylophilus ampelinus TaxID=54067 RepID=A0A318SPS6_9BURK|nr:CNP1-like family protein [Xylophilus ampelinus]MCS4509300.1 CNP1-like family protein [Xylophilus ampelinus]PYE79022.1 CNP1-like family protein [Xylophilus ampelinus]